MDTCIRRYQHGRPHIYIYIYACVRVSSLCSSSRVLSLSLSLSLSVCAARSHTHTRARVLLVYMLECMRICEHNCIVCFFIMQHPSLSVSISLSVSVHVCVFVCVRVVTYRTWQRCLLLLRRQRISPDSVECMVTSCIVRYVSSLIIVLLLLICIRCRGVYFISIVFDIFPSLYIFT